MDERKERNRNMAKIMKHHDHKELANQLVAVADALDVEVPYDCEDFQFINNLLMTARQNTKSAKKLWVLKRAITDAVL